MPSTMRKRVNRLLLLLTAILLVACALLWKHTQRVTQQRDRYRQNSEALLGQVTRLQIDSTRRAVDVKTLRLTVSEYQEYRAQDAKLIKSLGVRIRNLEAAAKHRLKVEAQITASIKDSLIVRDTVFVPVQTVEMVNPHIVFRGVIQDSVLTAKVHVPVTLNQAVWIEYKRRWLFWKRIKAIHQTIASDNPYVDIEYSEYIKIHK